MPNIFYPLEWGVAWVMVFFHSLLERIGMPADSGWTWGLSIIGLVIVIRIILIPLFVKQIKASRGLQLIQPQIQEIQKKYKGRKDPGSRQAMTQETMALYKNSGTNPLASCLPIILQAPIFYALFRVLNTYIRNSRPIGPLSTYLSSQAEKSTILGAPLSSTFLNSNFLSSKIITIVLIVLMSLTSFFTQYQLMRKNIPLSALDNPFARQQKALLYLLPIIFAISGVNFPIGVLIYWLTTNVWSLGQQFYVIRHMPAPGSLAEEAFLKRKGHASSADSTPRHKKSHGETKPDSIKKGQREQPKRKNRSS
ncbi:MAG: membrane protein insertase YidC [Actinomycetota bacterium]